MSPHRSGGKGTLVLAREFSGIRRIHRGSGTNDPAVLQEIQGLLSKCRKKGRNDLIRAIAKGRNEPGRLHPLTLLEQSYKYPIEQIPAPDELPLVKDIYAAWADAYDASDSHRRNLKSAFRGLLRTAGQHITVGDLPEALRKEKGRLARHAAQFNRSKAAVQAYLGDTLGIRHHLYLDVAEIKQLDESRNRRERPYYTPAEFGEKMRQLRQPYAGMAWTLALTGMEPRAVYIEGRSYVIKSDRVEIHGTKMRRRDTRRVRDVPLVGTLVDPGSSYKPFLKALATVGLEPYDLRHLYAKWLDEAGVEYNDRERYMGHQPKTRTDHYTAREIAAKLRSNAKKLERFIGTAQRMMGAA